MKWVTKTALKVENAELRGRLQAVEAEAERLRQYSSKMELLVDHERERIDGERERADRATDALLQQNALAPITSIGVEEATLAEEESKKQFDLNRQQLAALYQESMDDGESDDQLVMDFLEPVKELVNSLE